MDPNGGVPQNQGQSYVGNTGGATSVHSSPELIEASPIQVDASVLSVNASIISVASSNDLEFQSPQAPSGVPLTRVPTATNATDPLNAGIVFPEASLRRSPPGLEQDGPTLAVPADSGPHDSRAFLPSVVNPETASAASGGHDGPPIATTAQDEGTTAQSDVAAAVGPTQDDSTAAAATTPTMTDLLLQLAKREAELNNNNLENYNALVTAYVEDSRDKRLEKETTDKAAAVMTEEEKKQHE